MIRTSPTRSAALVALACSLMLWACSGGGDGDQGNPTDSGVATLDASDSGAANGDTSAGDAVSAPDTTVTPSFELGTNVTGKNTRKYYTAVPEGSTLTVELGPQGLWMVVLAFKTRAMLKPPLFLSGGIEVDDNDAAGKLALKKQKTILSDDGFDYYYNFWLVLKNDKLPLPSAPVGVAGKKATITLDITDSVGFKHQVIRHVTLKGGPQG